MFLGRKSLHTFEFPWLTHLTSYDYRSGGLYLEMVSKFILYHFYTHVLLKCVHKYIWVYTTLKKR